MEKLKEIISKLVQVKIKDLGTYKKVRYSDLNGNIIKRSYFEMTNLKYEFDDNNFNDNVRLLYLNELKKNIIENNIEIYDNLPSEAPNVTLEFINLIDEEIILIELKNLKDNKPKLEKPYSDIFKDIDSYLIFDKFMKTQIVNTYKDVSFLYQQLNTEKRLLKIKHLEFAEMLINQNYINKKDYRAISDKKGFDNKSTSTARLNNYYNIVNEIEGIKS